MHTLRLQVGPARFELSTPVRRVMDDVRALYRDFPKPGPDEIVDYSVRALPIAPLLRLTRPALRLEADFLYDDIPPIETRLGLLAFEMAVNLQMALGYRRQIIFHASSSEKDGRALVMTGDSGSGKSTLSALLAYRRGWRHLGDELAILSTDGELALHPFPRPISLKNESIPVMEAEAPADRFGPLLENTVKGTVRHLLAPVEAIDAMDRPAAPALIVNPRFLRGAEPKAERLSESGAFARLSISSTNQLRIGKRGFAALAELVRQAPAYDITYGSSDEALALVDELWARHA